MSLILGIETSCDETAAAVIRWTTKPEQRLCAQRLLSQLDDHRPYGGVVPEIAARSHLDHLDGVIADTLAAANCTISDLSAIAATSGPGLAGGLIVGTTMAKAISMVAGCPFIAINHLEGHVLSPRLLGDIAFPYLVLLVSGGHCQLLAVEAVGGYRCLGKTRDDAVGEAFDKTAKMLGLGYPGGPAVERCAKAAHAPHRFPLPRPMVGRAGCDFSFSGLKTAVRRHAEILGAKADYTDRYKGHHNKDGHDGTARDIADLCAAFQQAVGAVLADRTQQAMSLFRRRYDGTRPQNTHQQRWCLAVVGGVAANHYLRRILADVAAAAGFTFIAPPSWLCTDNAAMIAWAGAERLASNLTETPTGRGFTDQNPTSGLGADIRPRWPLDPA